MKKAANFSHQSQTGKLVRYCNHQKQKNYIDPDCITIKVMEQTVRESNVWWRGLNKRSILSPTILKPVHVEAVLWVDSTLALDEWSWCEESSSPPALAELWINSSPDTVAGNGWILDKAHSSSSAELVGGDDDVRVSVELISPAGEKEGGDKDSDEISESRSERSRATGETGARQTCRIIMYIYMHRHTILQMHWFINKTYWNISKFNLI